MTHPPEFDRQVSLGNILGGIPKRALDAAMNASIGPAWRIVDGEGTTLREGGAALEETVSAPLVVDLEPVGILHLPPGRAEQLPAVARWIELLLGASNRYRMAADLHLEAVHADHRELMERHAELAESEQRYRTLSAELEERVRRQVAAIEHAQRRLYQAEKLAAMGNLAAGMAHEINNPIGFMRSNLSTAKGYVKMLATSVSDAAPQLAASPRFAHTIEDFDALIDESLGGADRVARIVAALKAYTTIDAAPRVPSNPNDAVRGAVRMLGALPPEIYLDLALQPVPALRCDIDSLARALHALLLNAKTAMKGRAGTIRVASRRDGDWVEIAVSDQGVGIAPDRLSRVFDPFYTTQDVGGGMGLGLTVASDVVRAHDGHIEAESVEGEGATFRIRLPLAAGAEEQP